MDKGKRPMGEYVSGDGNGSAVDLDLAKRSMQALSPSDVNASKVRIRSSGVVTLDVHTSGLVSPVKLVLSAPLLRCSPNRKIVYCASPTKPVVSATNTQLSPFLGSDSEAPEFRAFSQLAPGILCASFSQLKGQARSKAAEKAHASKLLAKAKLREKRRALRSSEPLHGPPEKPCKPAADFSLDFCPDEVGCGYEADMPLALGSPEHVRAHRLPPPSVREKMKKRDRVQTGKSLNFVRGTIFRSIVDCGSHNDVEVSATDLQREIELTDFANACLGRLHRLAEVPAPPELPYNLRPRQVTSTMESCNVAPCASSGVGTSTTQLFPVVRDAFQASDLPSHLDLSVEEVLCEIVAEFVDEVGGLEMVTVLSPECGKLVNTFKSNVIFPAPKRCRYQISMGDHVPDICGPGVDSQAMFHEQSPPQSAPKGPDVGISAGDHAGGTNFPVDNLNLADLQITELQIETNLLVNGLSVQGLSTEPAHSDDEDADSEWALSDADKAIGNDESGVSSDDDWLQFEAEILEEDLPKIGLYPEDQGKWKSDPFEWRFSDENWSNATAQYGHDTSWRGGDETPLPKLVGEQTPLSIFTQIWDVRCMRLIIRETNRYAASHDSCKTWIPLTRAELKSWIGILIYMGIYQLPDRRMFWRTDNPLFCHKLIPSIMCRDRFEHILSCLHLVDNSQLVRKGEPGFDKICKVRPFLDLISENSRKLKEVDRYLTVDEMVILGGGRFCPIMQHNPNKPVKFGIKILATCGSGSKYVFYFSVYCGAANSKKQSVTEQTLAMLWFVPRHLNHCVTMDNWFSSVRLFTTLLEEGILCLGTVRTNRVGWPKSLSVRYEKAKQGDLVWSMHRSTSIAACMWMDHTQVAMLSTWVSPLDPSCSVTRWERSLQERIQVPTSPMIPTYQLWMRGVDVQDQLRGSYNIGLVTRKWWHRLFFFGMDTALTNSWIAYQLHQRAQGRDEGTHVEFRMALAHSLVFGDVVSSSTARTAAMSLRAYIPPYAERGATHFSIRSTARRLCVECRSRTSMACPRCHWAPMCLGYCFVTHHSRRQNCCNRQN